MSRLDANQDAALDPLLRFLEIKSISTDPAYAADCRTAAEWLVADLAGVGFDAAARPTPGHPMAVAHDRSAPGPAALFYGHHHVQPVDPRELWENDPFQPFVEIRARGASDDKGQIMTFVEACRAWKEVTGSLPIRPSIMIDGEEEPGRVNLPSFLKANAAELAADIGLICDTSRWDARTPAIQTMLRGLCGEELIVTAAERDLHAGFYGSAAANPNHVLARILADLHDAQGRVAIPGFYDGVPELPPALKAEWDSPGFDAGAFLGAVGLSVPAGEAGRSVLEMAWSRPTCEVNGMGGGCQGQGFKTVIPAQASAKVSFRLVFDQDPHAIRKAFRAFVQPWLPADCKVDSNRPRGAGRGPAGRCSHRANDLAPAGPAPSAWPVGPRPGGRADRRVPGRASRPRRRRCSGAPAVIDPKVWPVVPASRPATSRERHFSAQLGACQQQARPIRQQLIRS